MNNSKEKSIYSILFYLVFAFAICLVLSYKWDETIIMGVLGDEFGYWGNASVLSGLKWTPLMSESAYYGLGYSILLCPLMYITNYKIRYHVAIILNGLLLFGMGFFARKISYKFSGEHKIGDVFPILLSVLTVSSIFQARIAWSETAVSFFMWVLVYAMVCFEDKITIFRIIIISLIEFFMIFIHQRTLPVAVLSVMITEVYLLKSKKSKEGIIRFGCFVLVLAAYNKIKAAQIDAIYMQSASAELNNYGLSDSTGWLENYVNAAKLYYKDICFSFVGKLIVIFLSTYCLIGVLVLLNKHMMCSKYLYTKVFIVSSLIVMSILTSMTSFGVQRLDYAVYSRYFDYSVGPVILLCFSSLKHITTKANKLFLAISAVIIALEKILIEYMSKSNAAFNYSCSPLFGGLLDLSYFDGKVQWDVLSSVVMKFSISMIFLCLIVTYGEKKGSTIKYVALFVMIATNIFIANNSSKRICEWRNNLSKNAYEIDDITSDDTSVFYCNIQGQLQYLFLLQEYQFINSQNSINKLDYNKPVEDLGECYIISDVKLDLGITPLIDKEEYKLYYFGN
ncbi:hypothetical protein [Butyrivibrio fibrisolvens]|uniref:hypothetical protein n=1 Tax=Butyrivibrio fibrisolvens TaxID=831 RepID=UPI00042007C3|nr:hypothetical protein [Butyrivibrio fibrisolvens]